MSCVIRVMEQLVQGSAQSNAANPWGSRSLLLGGWGCVPPRVGTWKVLPSPLGLLAGILEPPCEPGLEEQEEAEQSLGGGCSPQPHPRMLWGSHISWVLARGQAGSALSPSWQPDRLQTHQPRLVMNSWAGSHLGGSMRDVSLGTRFFLLFLAGLLGSLCLSLQSPAGHCSRTDPGVCLCSGEPRAAWEAPPAAPGSCCGWSWGGNSSCRRWGGGGGEQPGQGWGGRTGRGGEAVPGAGITRGTSREERHCLLIKHAAILGTVCRVCDKSGGSVTCWRDGGQHRD